jgi:hypothetical protein
VSTGLSVVYLAGFGRSGSTLLERLLGELPSWVHVGELVDLARSVTVRKERCGCGEPFETCPVWSTVGRIAFGGWDAPEVRRLAQLRNLVGRQRQLPRLLRHHAEPDRDPGFAALVREYQEGYGRIYHAVAEVTGSSVIVDASKGPAHGVALADASSYDLSMLNLIRDPRAVAYSWSQRRLDRPQATADGEQMWRISAARSAVQWATLQGEIEVLRTRPWLRTARLRYEDLMQHPAPAVSSALAELGVDVPPSAMTHIDGTTTRLGTSHGLSGNPGRYETGVIQLRPDTRWRSGLPRRDQLLVSGLCLPLLLFYGYPVLASDYPPAGPRTLSRSAG